jgi:hypothetical protein
MYEDLARILTVIHGGVGRSKQMTEDTYLLLIRLQHVQAQPMAEGAHMRDLLDVGARARTEGARLPAGSGAAGLPDEPGGTPDFTTPKAMHAAVDPISAEDNLSTAMPAADASAIKQYAKRLSELEAVNRELLVEIDKLRQTLIRTRTGAEAAEELAAEYGHQTDLLRAALRTIQRHRPPTSVTTLRRWLACKLT